jgi:hypothetical protein
MHSSFLQPKRNRTRFVQLNACPSFAIRESVAEPANWKKRHVRLPKNRQKFAENTRASRAVSRVQPN